MNKRLIILILRQCTLAAILLAVSACSFKKDPVKPAPEVVVLQEQDKLVAQPAEVFAGESEDAILKRLEGKSVSDLENIHNDKNESLLDLAIQNKKKNVLSYLLARGVNPLLYSETSAKELVYNAQLKDILKSFERPLLVKIINNLKATLEKNDLNNQLQRMHFNEQSCLDLIRLIMEQTYYKNMPDVGDYNPDITEKVNALVDLRPVLGTSSCARVKDNISSSELAGWAINELVSQRNRGFKSTELFQLIVSLGSVEGLALEAYENGAKVRIDPLDIIACADKTNLQDFDESKWTDMVKPFRSDDLHYYSIGPFKTCERINPILDRTINLYDPNQGEQDEGH